MYSFVDGSATVGAAVETALSQYDAYKAINLFVEHHELVLNQNDKFSLSLHENDLKYRFSLDYNLPALRNLIPRIINKPISNTLILKFLEFYKNRYIEVGIIFYSRLYCKKNCIYDWDEVSKVCEDYFKINLDAYSETLEQGFQTALDEKNYTKALAIFKKVHYQDLLEINFTGLSQLVSAIQEQKVWDRKISNSYLKMICSHIKKLSETEKSLGNRLQDQFYFCILKQRQNIENWEEIERFFNSNLTADYYQVFYLAAWDYSFSSMSYLLANSLISADARNKFWYSTCYDTYHERQFDGYCMTRYGEDSAQFKQYVTLPALSLVIAVFTRPDMKHSIEELFNVIKLFLSHDAKCTSYNDGIDRGIDLYLKRYTEVKTRFLEQDERSQFELEWRRIQQTVSVKRGAAALPIYSIFNQNAEESEPQSAGLNVPGLTNL